MKNKIDCDEKFSYEFVIRLRNFNNNSRRYNKLLFEVDKYQLELCKR